MPKQKPRRRARKPVPLPLQRCVRAVAPKMKAEGRGVGAAFAVCTAQLQKAGVLKRGTRKSTPKGAGVASGIVRRGEKRATTREFEQAVTRKNGASDKPDAQFYVLIAAAESLRNSWSQVGDELRKYPRDPTGLTLDSAKDARWHDLRQEGDRLSRRLREVNSTLTKNYKKTLATHHTAQRDERRQSRLAGSRPNGARAQVLTPEKVAAMTPSAIAKALDRLEGESSRALDAVLAAGLGDVRFSEMRKRTDALSRQYIHVADQQTMLRDEQRRRDERKYGTSRATRFNGAASTRRRAPSRRNGAQILASDYGGDRSWFWPEALTAKGLTYKGVLVVWRAGSRRPDKAKRDSIGSLDVDRALGPQYGQPSAWREVRGSDLPPEVVERFRDAGVGV